MQIQGHFKVLNPTSFEPAKLYKGFYREDEQETNCYFPLLDRNNCSGRCGFSLHFCITRTFNQRNCKVDSEEQMKEKLFSLFHFFPYVYETFSGGFFIIFKFSTAVNTLKYNYDSIGQLIEKLNDFHLFPTTIARNSRILLGKNLHHIKILSELNRMENFMGWIKE